MDPVAAAAACPPALPEDVVIDILARVPDLVSLFRCSVVCKQWRRLVSNPAFLRRRWPEGSASLGRASLLGFFMQRHRMNASGKRKVSRLFPSLSPAFVPAPDSVLGPERRFLISFIRDDAGVLDEAKPLVARGGLLLVRLAPRSSDDNTVLRLCVCNLLSGKRESLLPLDASLLDDDGVRGYGLVTAADHDGGPPQQLADGYSTLFQVLLIGYAYEDGHLQLIKFSSAAAGSRRWRAYDCWQRTGVRMGGPNGCNIAAVAHGTARWLFRGNNPDNPTLCTLDVSVNTGHISVTMLPFDALPGAIRRALSDAFLCTVDARLSLVYFRNNRLVIWSRGHQNGTLVWRQSQFDQVGVKIGLFGESLSPVCAGENSGTILALYHSDPQCAYMLDLQSGSSTKVAGWTRSFNYMTVVSYEINWPMFFMSRLGVQI